MQGEHVLFSSVVLMEGFLGVQLRFLRSLYLDKVTYYVFVLDPLPLQQPLHACWYLGGSGKAGQHVFGTN